jgi:signal transduction histidine kinase
MAKQPQNTLILMIATNPSTCEGMKETLLGTHFVLQFAESAETGLQKAEELLPAVIVIDIEAQAIQHGERETNRRDKFFDPYATCRHLRANRVLNGIPIMMLCSRDERDSRAAGLSAGADDFLDKPLDGLELLARLGMLTRLSLTGRLLSDLTRFSWMVEHAHEGYLLLDLAGAIHYANERAQNLLNLPDNFIGLPFINVVDKQYMPEPAEAWENWLEDLSPCFLIQPEGPTARAVWVVLEALDTPMGAEYQRIVRLRDVTERMSLYHDMRKFHTAINHKLRTPVSMLYTSMSIIKNQIDNMTPEEIKKMIGSAIRGTERLTEEVRNIVTYIDAPLALNIGEPVKLEQMPGMVNAIAGRLHLKDVILSLPEDLRSIAIGLTPDALEMILYELMENSHKFHPSQSPRLEISVEKTENGFIHMRVVDNGLNLSVEQLDWAWVPYFQSEKDFTGEMPGTGLGFPMVATLVWKAGGTLRLRNRSEGLGVIVDLNIPLETTIRKMERSATPYGE